MDRGERFNTLTHLIGAALAIAGVSVLVVFASLQGDPWKIVSFSVYGFSLFTLYLVSTLYHGLRGNAKRVFFVLDHQAIYLLIAGTYTPVPEPSTFAFIFGFAALGFLLLRRRNS